MQYTVNDGFPYYVELVENKNYRQLFASQETFNLLRSISEEQSSFRYAPGKWSTKQIVGHITDHERIMTYRTLRFSRRDQTLLPGYDQILLVENSRSDELSFGELIKDFENVRAATNSFINSLSPEQLQLKGVAWKYELTVEEFLKATIGHELHHVAVLKEKYPE
ncbi:MAG TPA: DinB family protein [Parafilimonas sp.]|nr:DinB family protein [Parafilimonas sp.]